MSLKAGLNTLMAGIHKENATAKVKRDVVLAKDAGNKRWIDFVNPSKNRPILCLEWLCKTRGMPCGTFHKFEGSTGGGKSSFIYLLAGCAQKYIDRRPGAPKVKDGEYTGSYVIHGETENTLAAPDYLHSVGVDPDTFIAEHVTDLKSALEGQFDWVLRVRHPGGKLNPKDPKSTSMDRGTDPDKVHPLILTLDSASQLPAADGGGGIGEHARAFSGWFRNKWGKMSRQDVIYFASAQHREAIGQGGFGQETPKTTIAKNAFDFAATWIFDIDHKPYWKEIDGKNRNIGEVITIRLEKNKLGSKKGPSIQIHLMDDGQYDPKETRWNFDEADHQLIWGVGAFAPYSPIPEHERTGGGSYFGWCHLNKGKTYRKAEFLDALYADEKALMILRERLRIRGFGFDFEVNYKAASLEAALDVDPKDLDDPEGDGEDDPQPLDTSKKKAPAKEKKAPAKKKGADGA